MGRGNETGMGSSVANCRSPFAVLAFTAMLALGGCGADLPGTVAAGLAGGTASAADLAVTGTLPEKTMGRADAPVTIIEYASLGCPICASFHKSVLPKIKSAYIDTGKVRFIFREFPIGASPAAAAHAARCVEDRHFFNVNDRFMARSGQWNARNPDNDLLYAVVQDTGISRAAFDSCMANQEIRDGVNWVKLRGRELGVKGTPTFFINDDKIRGALSYDGMRQIIEKHLGSAANPA